MFDRILRMWKATPRLGAHSEMEGCDIRNVAVATIFTSLEKKGTHCQMIFR
jgi:hypothetical protein